MIGIEHFNSCCNCLPIALIMREAIPQAWLFDGHAAVHDVVFELPLLLPFLVLKVLKMRLPIIALLLDALHKVEEPVFTCALVEPVDTHDEIGAAHARPRRERMMRDQTLQSTQEALHSRDDTRIGGGLLVLRHGLEYNVDRPGIMLVAILRVMDWTRPAVFTLVAEDIVHPAMRLRLQLLIVEQKGQGHKAVQPVGAAFPSFGRTTNPTTFGNIGPEFIEVSCQSFGLNTQLMQQPSTRADTSEGQGLECFLNQLVLSFHVVALSHYSSGSLPSRGGWH